MSWAARNCSGTSPLTPKEREDLLDAFLSVCEWVPIYFLWRPNLPDEGDNHLMELVVAGRPCVGDSKRAGPCVEANCAFRSCASRPRREFMTRWRKQYGNDDDSSS